jgi:hypothetical protein
MTDFVVRKRVVDFQVKNVECAQTNCSAFENGKAITRVATPDLTWYITHMKYFNEQNILKGNKNYVKTYF